MPASRPQLLTPCFARRLWRTRLCLVAVAIVAFALLADHLLRRQARGFLVEQARLCATALVPGRDGDLTASVGRLMDRHDRLIAVATLDASGQLHTVYPERPAHRMAVISVLKQRAAGSVTMRAPQDGEPMAVTGVIVPLNGSPSPFARKAVILLKHESYHGAWPEAVMAFAFLVGVTALAGAYSMRRWFDRRIAEPLRNMTRTVRGPWKDSDAAQAPGTEDWCETAELAEQIQDLLHRVAQNDAYARRLEHETQHHIRKRQLGFDRQLRRLKDKATIDAITGLRNRAFLEDELEPLFARHHAGREDLAAVMIDLDNFKQYNDSHGHQAGDTLLRLVGNLLGGAIRPEDHAVRYGGDEFLLLLPDTNSQQAGAIAERLVKLFAQYTMPLGRGCDLSISAGVASIQADAVESGPALVARADAALYAAKRRGKNTVIGCVAR